MRFQEQVASLDGIAKAVYEEVLKKAPTYSGGSLGALNALKAQLIVKGIAKTHPVEAQSLNNLIKVGANYNKALSEVLDTIDLDWDMVVKQMDKHQSWTEKLMAKATVALFGGEGLLNMMFDLKLSNLSKAEMDEASLGLCLAALASSYDKASWMIK